MPTLDGRASLKIPAGTQTNKVFRLRGQGIPNLHGHGRGDELVRVIVETPTRLNEQQKKLLRQFDQISGDSVHPMKRKFLTTIRNLFE